MTTRVTGSNLMFDADDVRKIQDATLPRLFRIVCYGKRLTNEDWLRRFHHYFREVGNNGKTAKENSQHAATTRKFARDTEKMTFKMMRAVFRAMGWDIESIQVQLRDRLTGETQTFSTDDTVEKLDLMFEAANGLGGIDSIE